MCVTVYADERAGSVCEWERACPPARHSGAGGPGSPSGATVSLVSQDGTSGWADSGQLRVGSIVRSLGVREGWLGR